VGRSTLFEVSALERDKVSFDEEFDRSTLELPDNWQPVGSIRAQGAAELLDASGSRTIRIRGRIAAELENECVIGLEPIRRKYDNEFDLFYCPEEAIAETGEYPLTSDDADIGFYEAAGLLLSDVVLEQLLLWLPMRPECEDEETTSSCPFRKVERERQTGKADDPRWSALRDVSLN
jgi:uncharacterized metal-binding protein YceD (DUF177 family)